MNDTNLHGSAEMIHYRMIVFLKFALGSTKKNHRSTLWITDIDELFVAILWFGFWCGTSILRLHVGRPCQPLGKLVYCSILQLLRVYERNPPSLYIIFFCRNSSVAKMCSHVFYFEARTNVQNRTAKNHKNIWRV